MFHRSPTILADTDPEIAKTIGEEQHRQNSGLELIASENFVSKAVLEAAGFRRRRNGSGGAGLRCRDFRSPAAAARELRELLQV